MKMYIYLHTNHQLLEKSPVVVELDPEYFDSPFVQHVWQLDFDNFDTLKEFIYEANKLHAENIQSQLLWWQKEGRITAEQMKELFLHLDRCNEI